ncbi:hypothetical protein NESM_000036500 [Novymonas esmeraldas]|uniref:Conserved oligomeric Golgi complex subunit 3 n=1 Tax=Novymonas esmeraldas TaxID=1808958 RepID=A0AAW0F394_9TRYP
MATKPPVAGAGAESSLMRQLEMLLVPLHHRFRYPLPVPAHLATAEAGEAAAVAAAGTSGANAADAAELGKQVEAAELYHGALEVVEEQVPDLRAWQARVQRGAAQAENCYEVLEHVRSSVFAMQRVTESVQVQSDHLSHNASAMMVRKAKLDLVRDALEQNLAHFTHIDDLCREAGNPFLKAGSARFTALLQDVAKEMEFLSANTQYKSAKPYAMRLAVAQQTINAALKDAVQASFRAMELETLASPAFQAATNALSGTNGTPSGSPTIEDVSASQSPVSTAATAVPQSSASFPPVLRLRPNNVADSFEEFLAAVNNAFVASGEATTSLRRMAELRPGGFSYAGAEAFGEEMVAAGGRLEADPGMREVMDAYRDARVGVAVPLLRYWLALWYYLDTQNSQADVAVEGTAAAAAAAAVVEAGSPTDTGAARQQLSGVADAHTLPQLAEHICGLLQRYLAAESDVLARLWLRDDIVSHLLPKLVSSIAEEVYYVFRSRLLCVDDVGELAQTVESIQRVSLRQNTGVQDSQAVSDLWVRMIQDSQERLVFRTSVYLRQTVSRCTPTREIASLYLRCGTDAYVAAEAAAAAAAAAPAATATAAETAAATGDAARARMFYIPGVVRALQLLHWLYPTLEFSVFSVFAEEAVHHGLELVRQLVKLMRQMNTSDPLRDSKAFLCQLAHLQHLQEELAHVDANITVVEKHISFAALRKRRLELEQSSRESKKEVEMDLLKCGEHLTTAMFAFVTQPVSGAAKKGEAERIELVSQMKARAAGMEQMIAFYAEVWETRQDLVHVLRERVAELAAEVGLDIHAVPTAPVKAPTAIAPAAGGAAAAPASLVGPSSQPASPATVGTDDPTDHSTTSSRVPSPPRAASTAAEHGSSASSPAAAAPADRRETAAPPSTAHVTGAGPPTTAPRLPNTSATTTSTVVSHQQYPTSRQASAARAPSSAHADTELI